MKETLRKYQEQIVVW